MTNPLNGWLILDKPESISSAGALNQLKRGIKPNKIGHAGTLDPFASGVLLVAIGEATKTSAYAMTNRKSYEFTITWGENRDTIDPEGKVTEKSDKRPSVDAIKETIIEFAGEIEQVPPQFSAISVNGKRAYKLAREGKEVELKSRKVQIHKLELTSTTEETASFYIECGKGFYIRSLARDIAEKLGVCGYVSKLKRTSIGKFSIKDAISLDYIKNIVHNADYTGLEKHLYPTQAVLDDILVQHITASEASKLKYGQNIPTDKEAEVVAAIANGNLIAICEAKSGHLIPKRVFNL